MSRLAPRSRLRRRTPSGQALVELALILPILLVLFSSALDLGRLYYSQITINNAAKEGALEASRNPTSFDSSRGCDKDTNRVVCLVVNEAKGSLISIAPGDIALVCSSGTCSAAPDIGDTVEVSVTTHFSLITPLLAVFFGGQTFPVSSHATAQLGVVPEPGLPTPTPTATPTPTPTPTSTATPTATPSPTPTPLCVVPTASGPITIAPGSGTSVKTGPGTTFTMTAPTVDAQPAGCSLIYTWSFGDGASGSGPSVTHQYSKKGIGVSHAYTVTLSISATGVPATWTGSNQVFVS